MKLNMKFYISVVLFQIADKDLKVMSSTKYTGLTKGLPGIFVVFNDMSFVFVSPVKRMYQTKFQTKSPANLPSCF